MDGGNETCIKDFNRKTSVKERKLDVYGGGGSYQGGS
jgi:hypothetical protein